MLRSRRAILGPIRSVPRQELGITRGTRQRDIQDQWIDSTLTSGLNVGPVFDGHVLMSAYVQGQGSKANGSQTLVFSSRV